jgi:uncharacterized protein
MRILHRHALWLMVLALVMVMPSRAQVPPPSDRLVTDLADFLEPVEERALERKLRAYADTTSTQIVVVTVQNLDGMESQEFALEIGRTWGVGQEGRDNGIVFLVSRAERQIRIEVGYGLEGAVPDAIASRIVREVVTPSFKQGQFFAGINAGVDLIMAAAAGEFEGLPTSGRSGSGGGIDPIFLYLAFIFIYFVISGIRNKGGGKGGYRKGRRDGLPIIFWGGGLHGGNRGGGFGGGMGGGFGGGGFGGFGGGGFGGGGAGGSW